MGVSARGRRGEGGLSCSQLLISRAEPPGEANCPPWLPGPERLAWVFSGGRLLYREGGGSLSGGTQSEGGSPEWKGWPVMKTEGPFPRDWAVTWMPQGLLEAPEWGWGRGACLVTKEAPLESGMDSEIPFLGTEFPRTGGGLGLYRGTPAR